MVVFLCKFINDKISCPYGTYVVNIKEEIQKYKSKNPGRKSVIVFDFCAALRIFVTNNDELLSGGRLDFTRRRMERFLQKLKDMGAELVFFNDGQIKKDKFPSWLNRVNGKYEEQCEIFRIIERGQPVEIPYRGQSLFCLYEVFLRIAAKYGKIFVSLHNECDIDCAAYASKVEAVAVITMDTDFLIMPGDWPIWTTQSIDLERLTATAWNKKAVRTGLNLKQSQMPIFATLSGNDWVAKKLVDHIFRRYRGRHFQFSLSEFIRAHYPNGVPLSTSQLLHLANEIYNYGLNSCSMEEAKNMVNMSLQFYDYEAHPKPEVTPEWLKQHIEETGSNFIYTLVNDLPLVLHQSFIDLSRRDFHPYCKLALPIVRKQLGVADYHKGGKNIDREIYLKPSHLEPYQKQIITPIIPDFDIPPLNILLGYDLTEEENARLMDKRLKIFCWIISTKTHCFEHEVIKTAENKTCIISAFVLTYLVKELQITSEEADIMLISIHETINKSQEELESIEKPKIYNGRAFWIAHVFLRLRKLYFEAFIICGLYKYREYDSYDGFIFHKLFKNYQSMNSDSKRSMRKPIEKYRLYADMP